MVGVDLLGYIRECLSPRDRSEWVNEIYFKVDRFMSMKQDGIYVSRNMPSGVNNSDIEYISVGNCYISRRTRRQVAWLREDGTYEWDDTGESLYRRLLPPPIETVNHTYIIWCIIESLKKEKVYNGGDNRVRYVEYGVRDGGNFAKMSEYVSEAYGVDICIREGIDAFSRGKLNTQLYEMTTDVFRDNILPYMDDVDVVFIDADHSSKSVISDFEGIISRVNAGGYIVMHDTYPCNEDYLHAGACHDCYKTPMYIKEKYKDEIEILTLPLNPGVTIVRKK
jgi:hypothetical protein